MPALDTGGDGSRPLQWWRAAAAGCMCALAPERRARFFRAASRLAARDDAYAECGVAEALATASQTGDTPSVVALLELRAAAEKRRAALAAEKAAARSQRAGCVVTSGVPPVDSRRGVAH